MKKFLSLLLTFAMVFSLAMPAMAAEGNDNTKQDVTASYTPTDTTAKITGVSITVDGETYTEGNVTITPTSTVVYTVTGTNFANLSTDNYLSYALGYGSLLTNGRWTIDTEDNTATWDFSDYIDWFERCNNFEVTYSNDGGTTQIPTGIYLTYDDGIAEEDKAQITGVSITVDGTEYTSGTATIAPGTQSIILNVTGTNLQNGTWDNFVAYAVSGVPVTQGYSWIISDDGTSATKTCSVSAFVNCTNAFEIQYCNDGQATWIGSGIYVLYDDGNTTLYDVTVMDSEHGTVKAPPKSAENGQVFLTVIPDAGYQLGTLTATAGDGTTINPSDWDDGIYVFTMPAGNVTVTATFVPEDTDTTPAKITGVSITVDNTTYTSGQTAVITPDTESIILNVTGTNLQNGTLDNLVTYTDIDSVPVTQDYFVISDDGTSATCDLSSWKSDFEGYTTAFEIQYSNDGQATWINSGIYVLYDDGNTTFYDVTVTDSEHGTVKAPPKSAENGRVFLTVIPDAGYQLGTLTVTAGDGTTINPSDWGDGTYFFYMPEGNVTVTATFVADTTPTYAVTTDFDRTRGTVTVDKTTATAGETVTVTFTPEEGYVLFDQCAYNPENSSEEVTLTQGTDTNTYTFTMPAHAVQVNGDFVKDGKARTDLYFNNGGNTDWTDVYAYFYTDSAGLVDSVLLTMAGDGVYTLPEGKEIPNLAYKVYFGSYSNSTAIFDIPTDAENMFTLGTTDEYGNYEGTWSVYTPSQPPTDVTSADIVWGSLAYTYTDGSGWANNDSSEDAGTVTVTNTGDTTIEVQPSYNPETGYTEITGSFGDNNSVTLEEGDEETFTLILSGQPNAAIEAGTKIGTVTIRIIESASE